MSNPIEAVISKIKKLRELAKSSNVHEATNAAAAAERLIAEHRLSEVELSAQGDNGDEPIIDDGHILYETGRIIPWKSSLAVRLAKHYGIYLMNDHVYGGKNNRKISRYSMIGRLADIQICQYQYAYIVNEIDRLCKLECTGKGHIAAASYCIGAVTGIMTKMRESLVSAASTHSTALVKLDNRAEEAKQFKLSKGEVDVYKRGPLKGKPKSGPKGKSLYDHNSYQKGVRDGKDITLLSGLSGGKQVKELK